MVPKTLSPTDPDARYKLVLEIQRHLKRVGCYWGRIDGSWGMATMNAMREFTNRVNATLPLDAPDYVQLSLIQSHADNACGACPAGELYAYGIGMGADPMDEKELAFVNEAVATPRALKIVPTFASVAAWGAGPGEMNLNRVMVVDGERDITFHRPLAVAAHITADFQRARRVRQGQGQGRRDPAQDRAQERQG